MTEFYTKLFVQTDTTLQTLLQSVAVFCGGTIDMATVLAHPIEIDVMENEYSSKNSDSNNFISYAFTVEVVNVESMQLEDYLEFTGSLMIFLHENNAKIVAACDWEERLPGNGRLV